VLDSGGTGDDVAAFAERLRARWPRVGSDVIERLVALYGSNAERLVDGIAADPLLAERFALHLPVTRAEVSTRARGDGADPRGLHGTARSRLLLWEPDNGLAVADGVARTMAAALGWDAARLHDEIGRYRALVERLKHFDSDPAETERRKRRMAERDLERVARRAQCARSVPRASTSAMRRCASTRTIPGRCRCCACTRGGCARAAVRGSPTSTEEVATLLRYANDARLPVVPYGGGSGVCGGVLPAADAIVVDLRHLDQLLELNEIALQAPSRPGCTAPLRGCAAGARLFDGTLAAVGEPVDGRRLGGDARPGQFSTAMARSRTCCSARGRARDGRIVRVKPTPRRAAGPDLRHLFLGTEGTAGIVTEITVRCFRCPRAASCCRLRFPDFDAGLEAIRHIGARRLAPAGVAALRRDGEWPALRPVAERRPLLPAHRYRGTGRAHRRRGGGVSGRVHRSRR